MATNIPILKVDDFLIATIQTALDDRSVLQFQNDLAARVAETGAAGVAIDLTAVDLVDSFMARSLNDIAMAIKLLGAQVALVGIQPHVAMTLVEMGLTIPHAIMALNLQKGLEVLRERFAAEGNQDVNASDEKRETEDGGESSSNHQGR
jgi:rsbT antagonist protein RsbS